MKQSLAILGSTGSVGLTTLKILDKKRSFFKVKLLVANKNFKVICEQIKKYKPEIFVISDEIIYKKVKNKFKNNSIKILNNLEKIRSRNKFDITISAIPGIAGLQPTLRIIKFSKKILIANKESIICGWDLIKNTSIKFKTKIIPIDSEHFSIFKLLENRKIDDISKVFITASGGPFLNFKKNQFKKIKPKDALRHPKWKMGKKISIDSSTLMNKLLELIEAQKLFNIPIKNLDILIHPQSLIHAIVVFKNGLTQIIYHDTSMVIPLSNAIFEEKLNIDDFLNKRETKNETPIQNLFFKKVNKKIFPVYNLKEKLVELPSTPIIINAANEILVDQFLQKNITFLSISSIIFKILRDRNYKKYAIKKPKNIKEIIKIDEWARETVIKYL